MSKQLVNERNHKTLWHSYYSTSKPEHNMT
jgi:hypothetical protein